MQSNAATVLVVDDERGLADLYSAWLDAEYEVLTAYDGQSALEQVDHDTDVVLLDRRMPDYPGDEVLEEIRARELPCHVAMVTAVEPDFDIVEMGFDDYVVKPVDQEELFEIVERMLAMADIGPDAKQYYSKVSKQSALKGEKDSPSLNQNSEFEELTAGIEAYDGMITSLAEEAIKAKGRELRSNSQSAERAELKEWQARLDSLDDSDPLYQVASERIAELQAELDGADAGGPNPAQEQFLDAVAEGFIAEGSWLNPVVKRALNLLLFNKNSEEFIINRRPLADQAREGPTTKFEVSQDIRDLASEELSERSMA